MKVLQKTDVSEMMTMRADSEVSVGQPSVGLRILDEL